MFWVTLSMFHLKNVTLVYCTEIIILSKWSKSFEFQVCIVGSHFRQQLIEIYSLGIALLMFSCIFCSKVCKIYSLHSIVNSRAFWKAEILCCFKTSHNCNFEILEQFSSLEFPTVFAPEFPQILRYPLRRDIPCSKMVSNPEMATISQDINCSKAASNPWISSTLRWLQYLNISISQNGPGYRLLIGGFELLAITYSEIASACTAR